MMILWTVFFFLSYLIYIGRKETLENWFETLLKNKQNYIREKQYLCFNDYKIIDENQCRKQFGDRFIWDAPCNRNEDCPFYMKNMNYPNYRGGCQSGFCEMPINIRRKGFRQFDAYYKPFCHNCEIKNDFICCEKQQMTKNDTLLRSPDYMFNNDYLERLQHQNHLYERGLAVV